MSNESNEVPKAVRNYMSRLGKKRTAAKTEAARENALKGAAARRKDPLDLPCTCKGGESLNAADHVTTCPRGRLLWQRERAAAAKLKKEATA